MRNTRNSTAKRQRAPEEEAARHLIAAGWRTTDDDEVQRRRLRATNESISVQPLEPKILVFGTFVATAAGTGRPHKVDIRSVTERVNTCDCPDFRVNGLGTCKHVESVLLHIQRSHPEHFRRARIEGSPRVEIYLSRTAGHMVRIAWPSGRMPALRRALGPFFSANGALRANPVAAMPALRRSIARLPHNSRGKVRIAADVDDWVAELERANRKKGRKEAFLKDVEAGKRKLNPLSTRLYEYQEEGMLHLAFGKRALLADDMGLGKTIQAIAAAELLRSLHGIQRVAVVSPVSLKAEWEEQISRFCGLPTRIVSGPRAARLKHYRDPMFFNLLNYEQVRSDVEDINRLMVPDLVILDEAQRIKNWQTQTAQQVKRLQSPFAFVLTGTPLENRIDELYSIVDFLDQHLLGPLFRFNRRFYQLDGKGRPSGYKNLAALHQELRPVMLRRLKTEVEEQLPERTVNNYFVPMHKEQRVRYEEYENRVARLMHLMKKRPLSKQEMDRLQKWLACMRMLCDSTFILDQETKIAPKVSELNHLLDDLLGTDGHKAVLFSEWERMLVLVRELLEKKGIGYSWHTGSVPQQKRRKEIEQFKEDPDRRVFLSTDAGATGLNLQAANVVVNMDLPWNPAKLEQRIARCWRKFQAKPVTVVNLVCEDSIEHRMLGTLASKQRLADGVLDGLGDFDQMDLPSGREAFVERLERVMGGRQGHARTLGPMSDVESEPAPQSDPYETLAVDLLERLSDKLLLLEVRRRPDGRDALVAVVDGPAGVLESLFLLLLEQNFPESGELPQLELLDGRTWETLERLAEGGLISFEELGGRVLHSARAPESEVSERRAERMGEARRMFRTVARKLRMGRVLAAGGFPIEALNPLGEALETALKAALWAVAESGERGDKDVSLSVVESRLVPRGIVPGDKLKTITGLRETLSAEEEPADGSCADLARSASEIVDGIGEYLT